MPSLISVSLAFPSRNPAVTMELSEFVSSDFLRRTELQCLCVPLQQLLTVGPASPIQACQWHLCRVPNSTDFDRTPCIEPIWHSRTPVSRRTGTSPCSCM